jgi:hypothetical protein
MTDRPSTGRDSGFALARVVRIKGSLDCGSVTGNSRPILLKNSVAGFCWKILSL